MDATPKLYVILLYDSDKTLIKSTYNLKDFFFLYRTTIQSNIEQLSKDCLPHIQPSMIYNVKDIVEDIAIIIYGYYLVDNRYIIIITNLYYPRYVTYQLLTTLKICHSLNVETIFQTYQNPYEVDKLLQLDRELDETKTIILDSVQKLLDRGESIQDIIDRTQVLEDSSKTFLIKSKKLNCCILL